MSGPDGLEQRTADAEERADYDFNELERLEQLADESRDALPSDLLDMAEARMTGFWLDRIIGGK